MMNEQSDIESVRLLDDPNEHLFSIVEFGLIQRIVSRDLPEVIGVLQSAGVSITDLVFAGWNIYHEFECARTGKNRTIFNRVRGMIVEPISDEVLFESLLDVVRLMHPEGVLKYRSTTEEENNIVSVFCAIIQYYRPRFNL